MTADGSAASGHQPDLTADGSEAPGHRPDLTAGRSDDPGQDAHRPVLPPGQGSRRTRLCGRHEAAADLQRARTLVEAARLLLAVPDPRGEGPAVLSSGVHRTGSPVSLPPDIAAAARTLALQAGVAAAAAACCAALGQRAARPTAAVPLLAAVRPSGVQMSEELAALLSFGADVSAIALVAAAGRLVQSASEVVRR